MKTDELREKYLDFFVSKGHTRRPSDVLVPRSDPSVLFTPAGMNQFKDHFLGRCKLEFTRATTCQKCLRTGDIENVGRTAYHHTFFEMLGNFSFGDYFKREAIVWAWEFLTRKEWLGLDPERLSVTVYLDDDEAAEIWARDIKLPPARIRRMDEDENFWPASAPSQGPDGVCGPCSEIYYQPAEGKAVEIWNLVFTQFNRVGAPPNNLRPLPSKNIDTGMGLERTAAVLQGVDTNFHIDILRPIVEAAAEVSGVKYQAASENGRRLRRITDHVRAGTFAIHENVRPGPNKENYVIRRLLRRAVLDGHQIGLHEPFLHRLVPAVAEAMRQPYPELGETIERVSSVIRDEEERFFSSIDAGLARIEAILKTIRREQRNEVLGREAADVYTTHGVPPELFESLAAEHNLAFDWQGFRREMERHGDLSGGGRVVEVFTSGPLDGLAKVLPATRFLGYETTESSAKVVALLARGELCDQVDELAHDEPITVVLDQTPFYGEAGGQVGDTGKLAGGGVDFEVVETQRQRGFVLHRGHLRRGTLKLGAELVAHVDAARRQGIRRAHSATHLLHHALQKHLGEHAQQQGSKVDRDWLRFDFRNPQAVTPAELAAIEREVNERIALGAAVEWTELPIADARRAGAMMLFGEKYPDIVRMVSMGDFSRELCGGTHLDNTGQVGLFKIVGEESVAAGIRRITAHTGSAAVRTVQEQEALLRELSQLLKTSTADLPQRVSAIMKEVRDLKKQAGAAPQHAQTSVEQLLATAEDVGGTKLIVAEVPGANAGALRQQIDQLRKKSPSVAVLLATGEAEKVLLVAGISRDLEEQGVSAIEWVRGPAAIVGGSGGGRPDMAQAGGKHPERLKQALNDAREAARRLLATGGRV
ncbi:MAG: alanine--tRNA ligase [Pirellulales bacterium]|nr:alanine--tRNA ligase [Pirellulales bacterium]